MRKRSKTLPGKKKHKHQTTTVFCPILYETVLIVFWLLQRSLPRKPTLNIAKKGNQPLPRKDIPTRLVSRKKLVTRV